MLFFFLCKKSRKKSITLFLQNFVVARTMVLVLKTKSGRSVPLGKRDLLALNALERTKLKKMDENVALLTQLFNGMKEKAILKPVLCIIRVGILTELAKQMEIVLADVPERVVRRRAAPMDFAAAEEVLQEVGLECSEPKIQTRRGKNSPYLLFFRQLTT